MKLEEYLENLLIDAQKQYEEATRIIQYISENDLKKTF